MIRSASVYCLNALGIVTNDQRFAHVFIKCENITLLIGRYRFFDLGICYEPLGVSLHAEVADYLWSDHAGGSCGLVSKERNK